MRIRGHEDMVGEPFITTCLVFQLIIITERNLYNIKQKFVFQTIKFGIFHFKAKKEMYTLYLVLYPVI